jgi:hypothetical protein
MNEKQGKVMVHLSSLSEDAEHKNRCSLAANFLRKGPPLADP